MTGWHRTAENPVVSSCRPYLPAPVGKCPDGTKAGVAVVLVLIISSKFFSVCQKVVGGASFRWCQIKSSNTSAVVDGVNAFEVVGEFVSFVAWRRTYAGHSGI